MSGKKKNNKMEIQYGNVDIDKDEFDPKHAKFRVTAFIDLDVVKVLREAGKKQGKGYQTLMNEILREAVLGDSSFENRLKRLESEVFKKKRQA